MTQHQNIRLYLKTGNSITPLEALNKFGCFRLSAVIYDLKAEGLDIETKMVSNGRKKFASYRISPTQKTLF